MWPGIIILQFTHRANVTCRPSLRFTTAPSSSICDFASPAQLKTTNQWAIYHRVQTEFQYGKSNCINFLFHFFATTIANIHCIVPFSSNFYSAVKIQVTQQQKMWTMIIIYRIFSFWCCLIACLSYFRRLLHFSDPNISYSIVISNRCRVTFGQLYRLW